MKIEDSILAILSKAEVVNEVVLLKSGQLDRPTYVAVNKVLEMLGGKWSKKHGGHVFASDPSEVLESALLFGEATDLKKQYQFYPTPHNVALRLLELAKIGPNMTVLEPSAGQGAISDLLSNPDVIELNPENRKVLESKGYKILADDFLSFTGSYDRIIANPPFSKQQDIIHATHMIECLSDVGRLVTVMSTGVLFRTNKRTTDFKALLDSTGEYSFEKLPSDAFASSGVGVNTCILTLQK